MKHKTILATLMIATAATPAFAEPTTQPTAAAVISEMDAAYAKLQSAQFDGRITGRFDVQGQQQNQSADFTSTFAAPNKFRHEAHDNILLGSTGTNVYAYLHGRNEYQSADAPKDRVMSADWPESITHILQEQNPSLMLAISKSAAAELNALSKTITLQPATVIDGVAFDTLLFDTGTDHQTVTLLVDPATHLLHEVKVDLRKSLEQAGTTNVKQAELTIDYTKVIADVPIAANLFAWTAPNGAILTAATSAVAEVDDALSDNLKALIGKEAPDFSLKGLDDKAVKLSDLKGSVVILDLWATWCGPCVAALPHLDQLYKDQSANGLKVFAIDQQEEKDKVQAFVTKKAWSLPVLLDTDATVAGLYKAEAIPETVVIGKDGKIKQIFVGGGNEEAIAALVAKEMK